MAGVRIIFAVLIALSLGLSPAIAAKAPHEHAPAEAVMAMADMEECDHASGDSGATSDEDCPDCSKNANCAPNCCVLKCFQRFVETPRSLRFIAVVRIAYLTVNAEKPAEQQYTPQPPPPRN
jgi:hypothetical protein